MGFNFYVLQNRQHYLLDLQRFAEAGSQPADSADPGNPQPEAKPEKKPDAVPAGGEPAGKPEKTGAPGNADGEKLYTQKDLDNAVKGAQTEATKLAKMNAEQRQQYAFEKLQTENAEKDAEIARLKLQAQRAELRRSAATILADNHDITATQDMLDFVVADSAEETNARIAKLVGILEADRKQRDEARAAGRTPRKYTNNGDQMSEIDKRIAKYQ